MKEKVSIGKVVDMLIKKVAEAVDNDSVPCYGFIRKPLSWALYQTWKYFDEHEKERERTQ